MCCPRYFQQISYFPFLISRYLRYPPTLYQSGWHVMTVLPHQHWLLPPVTNLWYTYHRVGWHSSIILSAVTDAMSNQNIIGVLSRYIYLFIVECRYGRYRYFDHWRVLQILNSVRRLPAPGSRHTWRCRGWRWWGGRRGCPSCPAGCSGPRAQPSAGNRATGIGFN